MISFRFNMNSSFNDYSTHPITVPKGQVDYSLLKKEGLDGGDLTILSFRVGSVFAGTFTPAELGMGHITKSELTRIK